MCLCKLSACELYRLIQPQTTSSIPQMWWTRNRWRCSYTATRFTTTNTFSLLTLPEWSASCLIQSMVDLKIWIFCLTASLLHLIRITRRLSHPLFSVDEWFTLVSPWAIDDAFPAAAEQHVAFYSVNTVMLMMNTWSSFSGHWLAVRLRSATVQVNICSILNCW